MLQMKASTYVASIALGACIAAIGGISFNEWVQSSRRKFEVQSYKLRLENLTHHTATFGDSDEAIEARKLLAIVSQEISTYVKFGMAFSLVEADRALNEASKLVSKIVQAA